MHIHRKPREHLFASLLSISPWQSWFLAMLGCSALSSCDSLLEGFSWLHKAERNCRKSVLLGTAINKWLMSWRKYNSTLSLSQWTQLSGMLYHHFPRWPQQDETPAVLSSNLYSWWYHALAVLLDILSFFSYCLLISLPKWLCIKYHSYSKKKG